MAISICFLFSELGLDESFFDSYVKIDDWLFNKSNCITYVFAVLKTVKLFIMECNYYIFISLLTIFIVLVIYFKGIIAVSINALMLLSV